MSAVLRMARAELLKLRTWGEMQGEHNIMIDKVHGQKYFEYEKINQAKRKSVDSPEFHLDAEKQGVIYERHEEKKKSARVEQEQEMSKASGEKMSSSVKVELSRQGKERAEREKARTDFSAQLRKFAETAVAFLKSLWDKIWNEPQKEEQEQFPEILEERMAQAGEESGQYLLPVVEESIARPAYTKDEIRAIFRRGDRREIEDFLSENGRRHLVKNSDLLTQYDKTGAIVGINRADKEIILHGDKNQIKL